MINTIACFLTLAVSALTGTKGPDRLDAPSGRQRLEQYEEIEAFRKTLRGSRPEDIPLDRLHRIVKAWGVLLADEGCLNPGGIPYRPRSVLWSFDGLQQRTEREQHTTLMEGARQLDACTRAWHVDGTMGNGDESHWDELDTWDSVAQNDNSLALRLVSKRGHVFALTIEFFREGVLRIRGDQRGHFAPAPFSQAKVTIANVPGGLEAVCGDIKLVIRKSPFRFSIARKDNLVYACRKIQLHRPSRDSHIEGFRIVCDLEDKDHFFGLGERFNSLDQKGRIVAVWGSGATPSNLNQYWTEAYKPMPLYYNPAGYGCFWNTMKRGRFDFGGTRPRQFTFEVFGDVLDQFLFVTDSPEQYIRQYTDLTGKPILPPAWAFTPWLGGGGERWAVDGNANKAATAMEVVYRMKELGIPHGAIYVEGIDPLRDNKAPELMALLEKEDIKALGWIGPIADLKTAARVSERPEDLFLKNPDTSLFKIPAGLFLSGRLMIDFTHPQADRLVEELWRDKVKAGYRGLMLDGADEVFEDSKFHNGTTGRDMHLYYSCLYHRSYATAFQKMLPGNHVLFGRAAAPGDQKYVMHFAGDHDESFLGLRAAMTGGLNAGICGLSLWGSDIGGYCKFWRTRPLQKDTYLRWLQFGCFSPLMRFHGTSPREPWRFDEEAVSIYKKYAWLRMNLQPYLQAAALESHETGVPLLRMLPFVYPADGRTYAIGNQYLLGPALMACPLTDQRRERSVYFPEGEWVSLFDLSRHEKGPCTKVVPAGLDEIPVYIKGGSILPLQGADVLGEPFSLGNPPGRIIVVPGKATGNCRLRLGGGQISVAFSDGSIGIGTESLKGYGEIALVLDRPPREVIWNGKRVEPTAARDEAPGNAPHWHFDRRTSLAVIRAELGGTNAVTVALDR